MERYYKVPFRQVYCETLRQWLASVIECHVVHRIDPQGTIRKQEKP